MIHFNQFFFSNLWGLLFPAGWDYFVAKLSKIRLKCENFANNFHGL